MEVLGPGRNIDIERQHRIDQVIAMWGVEHFQRPEEMDVIWANGDKALLRGGAGGFTITVTIVGEKDHASR